MKAAEKIAEPVVDRPLAPQEKKIGGPAVHFAFGTVVGSLYGAITQAVPYISLGFGTAYATAVWALGDELTVPKLGLAPPPEKTPAKQHLKYWLMHAVYGLTLDGSRRLLENAID